MKKSRERSASLPAWFDECLFLFGAVFLTQYPDTLSLIGIGTLVVSAILLART